MKLTDDELNNRAMRMLADYDKRTPGTIFSEGFRLTLPDAWRLQIAVAELRVARKEKPIGYKIGATVEGNRKLMGLTHPVWGRLWDTEDFENGAILNKSDFANISIEAEFGVKIARDIQPGQSMDEIVASIAAVYPLLELHNHVFRGEKPYGHELIANNCIFAGIVRGDPITDLSAPRETDLKLIYDGDTIDEWGTLLWPNDIVADIQWLAKELAGHGLIIRAGDILLTGAWGPPIPVNHHTRVDVTSSAFGNAHATFC